MGALCRCLRGKVCLNPVCTKVLRQTLDAEEKKSNS